MAFCSPVRQGATLSVQDFGTALESQVWRGRGAEQSSAHVFSHAFSRVSSPAAPLGLLGLAGPRRRGEARCWPAAWLAAASPAPAAAPAAPARAAACASARPAPAAGPAHTMYEIA